MMNSSSESQTIPPVLPRAVWHSSRKPIELLLHGARAERGNRECRAAPTQVIKIVSTRSKYFNNLLNYSFDVLIAFCAEICLIAKKSNEYLNSRICWYLLVFVGICRHLLVFPQFIGPAHQ